MPLGDNHVPSLLPHFHATKSAALVLVVSSFRPHRIRTERERATSKGSPAVPAHQRTRNRDNDR